MLNVTTHEQLAIARKRRGIDQAEAARLVKIGRNDWIAIELGRTVPAGTVEGRRIASAIELEFGIPADAWLAVAA